MTFKNLQKGRRFSVPLSALALSAMIALGGCSSSPTVHPPTPLPELSQSYDLHRDWQVLLGSVADADAIGLKLEAADKERLYVAATEGWLAALKQSPLDRWQDQVQWEKRFNEVMTAGPTLIKDRLYVGTNKASLYALNAENGKVLWQKTLSSEVLSTPVEAQGMVFVRTVDGKLYAINAETGNVVWVVEHELPNLSLRGIPPVTVSQNTVFVGWETGVVEALSIKDGSELWSTRLLTPRGRTDLERMVDLQSQFVMTKDRLYVLGFHGKLAALNPETGGIYWQKAVSGFRNMAHNNKALFVVTDSDAVQAYDLQSGARLWQQKGLSYRRLGDLHLWQDKIIVGDGYGKILMLDTLDGALESALNHGDDAIVKLLPQNDHLYVLDEAGYVTRYQLSETP
jgi:outer membrane protein assembly factor BamB